MVMCKKCDTGDEYAGEVSDNNYVTHKTHSCACNCIFEEYPVGDPVNGPFKYVCAICGHEEVN